MHAQEIGELVEKIESEWDSQNRDPRQNALWVAQTQSGPEFLMPKAPRIPHEHVSCNDSGKFKES
jgi:hypothetical protein